ncbi:MAG: transcriptional regulator [Bacteroidales bacterium]|nr:transcriptional regulator [Bacteroidales bacterium]
MPNTTKMLAKSEQRGWYALKVFYRSTAAIEKTLNEAGCETYIPRVVVEEIEGGVKYAATPYVSSLLFVRCTESFLVDFKNTHDTDFLYYIDLATKRPGRIRDAEFDNFKAATLIRDPDAEYLGSDTSWFKDGARVRVTQGVHAGREGWIRRIKGRKRFIVCVEGVSAVALQTIPPAFLEVLEPSKRQSTD